MSLNNPSAESSQFKEEPKNSWPPSRGGNWLVKGSGGEIEAGWKVIYIDEGGEGKVVLHKPLPDDPEKHFEKIVTMKELKDLNFPENSPVASEPQPETTPSQAAEIVSGNKVEQNSELAEKIINVQLQSLNIEAEALLREIPDFKFLSAGQKVLALENLKQNILGEIKEDSLAQYKSKFSQIKGSGWGRVNIDNAGVLANNIWLGISKTYQLKTGEKDREKELLAGGLGAHKETLEILTKGLKAYGPEAEVKKDGGLQINYLNKLEGASPAEQKIVTGFNEAATALAKIPDEWRYDSAKPADQKKFLLAEKNYEANKALALNVLAQKEGSEVKAAIKMNEISGQIRLNSFLNSNPKVETQLLKIKDQALIKEIISGVFRERGLYLLAGYASRTFAVLGLGVLGTAATFGGVVAGAGIIGYARSFNRAKEAIRQKDIMSRRGQRDEGDMSKIMAFGSRRIAGQVDATNEISVGLGEKINYLVMRLENETDEVKKIKLAEQLKTRLEYTKKYLDNGAVDFGSKKERLNNRMNLLTGMAQAETHLDLVDKDDKQRKLVEAKIQEKIYDVLDKHDKQISRDRQQYTVKQARKGMVLAMGFAIVGRLLGDFLHGQEGLKEGRVGIQREVDLESHRTIAIKPLGGNNNPETVNYLTQDPALKGNLDLKTTLLNQKVSVNVLAKGESIGTYVPGVNNNTPLTFVQPDGSVEVHGAGQVYVHPGDRVIQGEDGNIYVIKDSGIQGVKVSEHLVGNTPKVSEDNFDLLEARQPSSVGGTEGSNLTIADRLKLLSGDKNGDVVENNPGILERLKGLFGGNKKVGEQPKMEVPTSFAGDKEIDETLINNWNLLSSTDKSVYNNFANNSSLYDTNPDLAITNFLGQTPAGIIHEPGNTEIVVILKNNHIVVFNTENGQTIMQVDDGGYDVIEPEKIIAARKLIQSNLLNSKTPVDNTPSFVEDNTNTLNNNNVPINKETLMNLDNGFWDARPDVKMLEFNHEEFTPAQEIQIQNLYNERVKVLGEIQKQYNDLALKYSDNPQFGHFTHVVKTYYAVENGTVKSLVEGSSDPDKFSFDINELLKDKQNPKFEVSEHMKRIASQTRLKSLF